MTDNLPKSKLTVEIPTEVKKVMFAKILETEEPNDSGLASGSSMNSEPKDDSTDDCRKKGNKIIIEFQALNFRTEGRKESTFVRSQQGDDKRDAADISSIKGTVNTTINSSDGKHSTYDELNHWGL